jgi:hypothetical protein
MDGMPACVGSTVLVMIVDAEVVGSLEPRVSVIARDGSFGFLSLPNFFKRRFIIVSS